MLELATLRQFLYIDSLFLTLTFTVIFGNKSTTGYLFLFFDECPSNRQIYKTKEPSLLQARLIIQNKIQLNVRNHCNFVRYTLGVFFFLALIVVHILVVVQRSIFLSRSFFNYVDQILMIFDLCLPSKCLVRSTVWPKLS